MKMFLLDIFDFLFFIITYIITWILTIIELILYAITFNYCDYNISVKFADWCIKVHKHTLYLKLDILFKTTKK